jgi:hypothetical protein
MGPFRNKGFLLVLVLVTLTHPSASAPQGEDPDQALGDDQLEVASYSPWQQYQLDRFEANPQWFMQPGRPCKTEYVTAAETLFLDEVSPIVLHHPFL